MVDLNEMVIFTKVVKEGSFTAAAKSMGMPKSTVSRKVSQLERRLGVRLLHRTTRSLNLTEVGAAYYDRCARIVADAEGADLAVSQLHSSPRGTLRVTAPPVFGDIFLGEVITNYTQAYPEVEVDVVLTANKLDLVEEGIDVAIRIGRLDDSTLIARKLGDAQGFCCASPEYLKEHGTPQHPGDLQAHSCILLGRIRAGASWRFQGEEGPITVPVSGRLMSNSFALARQAALDHMGVAALPSFICADDIRAGRLTPVLQPWAINGGGVYAIYPSNRHLSAKVRAFLDALIESYSPNPPWVVEL